MRALIERIKQNIPEYRAYDEAATRNSIILPILNRLGWDIFSRDSVYPEYPVGSKRVDYSLRILGQNRFFIETKRCNVDLACHQEQLLGYAFHFGVELACLTNGITWQFFLPLKSGEWEQRLFYTVDFENQSPDEIEKFFADILRREAVEDRTAVEKAEDIFVKKNRHAVIKTVFPAVWKDLVTNPPREFLDVICDKIEKTCGYRPDDATVARFLLKTQRERPAVAVAGPARQAVDQIPQPGIPAQNTAVSVPDVERIAFRGIEIPLERTGSDSKGYFSEVIPKLIPVLTEQEMLNLKDFYFCRMTFDAAYPLFSEKMVIDRKGRPRSWRQPIAGYYVYSQWGRMNLEKWKHYLLSLAKLG